MVTLAAAAQRHLANVRVTGREIANGGQRLSIESTLKEFNT